MAGFIKIDQANISDLGTCKVYGPDGSVVMVVDALYVNGERREVPVSVKAGDVIGLSVARVVE